MSFVGVDIGASSTRYTSNIGEINELSNSVTHLPNNETSLLRTDTDDIESCLEVKIAKGEPEQKTVDETKNIDFFPANVLVGTMATKYNNKGVRPSVQIAKYKQRNNFISAVLACAVSKVKYQIDEDIDLYIAVPPSETINNIAEEEFKARLIGTYTVEFPKYNGGTVVAFKIRSVNVYAESFMAVTSYFFDMSGKVRDQARNFMTGTVLSLDIGASTTDASIVKGGRFIETSGETFHFGGNTARASLDKSISATYGINYESEDLDRFMAEGRIQSGNGWIDASVMVNKAKQDLASSLIAKFDNYFTNLGIPIRTVNAVIVSGGGSLQSQYPNEMGELIKTAEPMSFFVTEQFKQWSPLTAVVNYGEDARYANIKGLYIRAKVDELKRQQMAAQAQVPVQPTAPAQPVTPVQPVQQTAQPAQPAQQTVATAQATAQTYTNQVTKPQVQTDPNQSVQ